jgi:Flp pilus assembly protein TadD
MRRTFIGLFILMLLAACSRPTTTPNQQRPTVALSTDAPTHTPSPGPSSTPTATATSTPRPTAGPSLEELMATPNALAAAALLDQSAAAFEDLSDIYPHRAEPWLGLAGLALRQGDTAGALDYLRSAVEAEPTSLDAHRQLALLLSQLSMFEEAVETYSAMIALAPDDPDLLVARADAYARLGRSEEAITDLQAAQVIDPYRQYAWVNVTAAASGERFYEAAALIAAAGLEANPDVESLHIARGLALLSLENPQAAADEFTAAIAINELSYTAYHWRGRALANLGKTEDAIADLTKAGDLGVQVGTEGTNEGYEAIADAADLMAQSGQVDEAFAYIADYVVRHGSQDALLLGYARIEYRRGNPDLALGRLTTLMRDGYTLAYYWRGLINAAEGNTADAIDDFSGYLRVRRSGPDAESARAALLDLGFDPEDIAPPTITPTSAYQPDPGDD